MSASMAVVPCLNYRGGSYTFTVPAERDKAIAGWSTSAGLGVAIGPTLGGWLVPGKREFRQRSRTVTRKWALRDSNPRPAACKAAALTS